MYPQMSRQTSQMMCLKVALWYPIMKKQYERSTIAVLLLRNRQSDHPSIQMMPIQRKQMLLLPQSQKSPSRKLKKRIRTQMILISNRQGLKKPPLPNQSNLKIQAAHLLKHYQIRHHKNQHQNHKQKIRTTQLL